MHVNPLPVRVDVVCTVAIHMVCAVMPLVGWGWRDLYHSVGGCSVPCMYVVVVGGGTRQHVSGLRTVPLHHTRPNMALGSFLVHP
jgi:hypothetical protein